MIRDRVSWWLWWGLCRLVWRLGIGHRLVRHGPDWLWLLFVRHVVARAWWAEDRIEMRRRGLWPLAEVRE